MANSTDTWRDFFRSTGSDIFDVIENAIMVAAYDYPNDFKKKRDRLAEILFTCKNGNCDDIESGCIQKSHDDDHEEIVDINGNHSYKSTECCNEYNKKEYSQLSEDVLRIKETIDNNEDKSDVLLDSLRRLQSTRMTYEILEETKIGISVNALRKRHQPKEIQGLAKMLVGDWKLILYSWCESAKDADTEGAEVTLESVQKSVAEKKKPMPQQLEEKFKCDDEASFDAKLEISKRKLHERYQQVEKAKKRRTTQFVDFHDLPVQRNKNTKPVQTTSLTSLFV